MPFDTQKELTVEQQRCLELAEIIERSATFDMSCFRRSKNDECGTPACVAGHAAGMAGVPLGYATRTSMISAVAQRWLGLSGEQRRSMFAPHQQNGLCWKYDNITAPMASAMLRRFVADGLRLGDQAKAIPEYRWEDDPAARGGGG